MVDQNAARSYSFPLNWRNRLSGVQATATSLGSFRLGSHNILSYKLEFQSVTVTGGTLSLTPKGPDAGIVIIAFSIIVMTQNSSDLELITFSDTTLANVSNFSYFANSSKFQLGSIAPYNIHSVQWVTGDQNTSSFVNYWFYTNLTIADVSLWGYYLKLIIYTDTGTFMTGFKINVLLVSRLVNEVEVAYYTVITQTGQFLDKTFIYNLGVSTELFGQPASGQRCVHGLQ
jgi:hypothetical protein